MLSDEGAKNDKRLDESRNKDMREYNYAYENWVAVRDEDAKNYGQYVTIRQPEKVTLSARIRVDEAPLHQRVRWEFLPYGQESWSKYADNLTGFGIAPMMAACWDEKFQIVGYLHGLESPYNKGINRLGDPSSAITPVYQEYELSWIAIKNFEAPKLEPHRRLWLEKMSLEQAKKVAHRITEYEMNIVIRANKGILGLYGDEECK